MANRILLALGILGLASLVACSAEHGPASVSEARVVPASVHVAPAAGAPCDFETSDTYCQQITVGDFCYDREANRRRCKSLGKSDKDDGSQICECSGAI
jgi:hypothetical protein